MQYKKREQTVTRKPGEDNERPMIRIANRFLIKSGFKIGSKFSVEYSKGAISIILKNN